MGEWGLNNLEQEELDNRLNSTQELPEGWTYTTFVIPESFKTLFDETIQGYKLLRETDKVFPALEAIFVEARNSLPQEVLDMVVPKSG